MAKTGLILVVAGLTCAAIALKISWQGLQREEVTLRAPGDVTAQPLAAHGATVATPVRHAIAPNGWRAEVNRATALPGEPKPTAVVVSLPRRTAAAPATSLPPAPRDRASLVRALQNELKRAGCYRGQVTGEWTHETRKAMQALTIRANAELPVDAPDDVLLALVEGQPENICGTGCPSGEGRTGDGRCLPEALLAKNVPTPPPPTQVTVTNHAVPQEVATGGAKTTVTWGGSMVAAPAAPPETVTPPEGRMALAGPNPEVVRVPAAPQRQMPRTERPHVGFGPSFFKTFDRDR